MIAPGLCSLVVLEMRVNQNIDVQKERTHWSGGGDIVVGTFKVIEDRVVVDFSPSLDQGHGAVLAEISAGGDVTGYSSYDAAFSRYAELEKKMKAVGTAELPPDVPKAIRIDLMSTRGSASAGSYVHY
jgi:hypothetical protein